MMNYQEFTEEMLKRLKEYYGNEAEVSIRTKSCSNNGYREALSILFTGIDERICPLIYLDVLYEAFCEGQNDIGESEKADEEKLKSIDDCVEMVVRMRSEFEPDDIVKENARKLMDWNSVKNDVYPILVPRDGNEQFLASFIYTPFLDLAVIYEVRIREDENGTVSSKISNDLFSRYELTQEELHEQAIRNMKKDGYLLTDMMLQVMGLCLDEEPDEVKSLDMKTGNMYVLTNRSKRHGAAILLDEELLGEKIGNKTAYIIPSSIHETLWMLADEDISVEKLDQTIYDVNKAEVKACERLSDHCYIWDGEAQKVVMAA